MSKRRVFADVAIATIKKQSFWAAVIFLVAIALGKPPPQDALLWPDSGDYLGFSNDRMPVYSLVAAAFENGYAIVRFQFLLTMGSWCWLGWVLGRAVGVLLAACFALSVPIMMWAVTVLSEPVSLSLLAASVAATIALYRSWSRFNFAVWCVVVALFALTRTTNMFLIPFLVVPFLVEGRRRLIYVAAAGLVVFMAADVYSRTAGAELRRLSLANVYTGRILLTPDRREYFVERGMPVEPEMEPYVGKTGRANVRAFFEAFPHFEAWFDDKGAASYYGYLFTRSHNYTWPWHAMVNNRNYADPNYAATGRGRVLSGYLVPFYRAVNLPWWMWLMALLLPLVSWALLRRVTADAIFAAALVVATYVQAYASFHGDKAEVGRHLIPALVLYKVTVAVMVVAAVSLTVTSLRERKELAASRKAAARGPASGKRRTGKREPKRKRR